MPKMLYKSSTAMGLATGILLSLQMACNDTSFHAGKISIGDAQLQAESAEAKAQARDAVVSPSDPSTGVVARRPDTVISSFLAARKKDASYAFSLSPRQVAMDFKLVDNHGNQVDRFTQDVRPAMTDSYKQGTLGQKITQSFDQKTWRGLVDILVIVDNSASMAEEQVNLGSKLQELLVAIKEVNWQIGVLTTSPSLPSGVNPGAANSEGRELCQLSLIKSTESDAEAKFTQAVNAGLKGNANEQGIRQAVVGLRCNERPWLRADASLAVLIVSDEDNCSNGTSCGRLPWSKPSYLTNFIETTLKRTIGKNAGIYGLIGPSQALCASATPATQYMQLFASPDNYGNICDTNFTKTLNRISANIASLLDQQFELSASPDDMSLSLSQKAADGSIMPIEAERFLQIGKVISFKPGKEPPAGSQIIASYVVGARPVLSNFPLLNEPGARTVKVKINGIEAPLGSYNVAGKTLNFTKAPPELADITVDYRAHGPLKQAFKPTIAFVPNTLRVFVNGQPSAATFDTQTGLVTPKVLPMDGQSIELAYQYRQGPQLSYWLPVDSRGRDFLITDQGMPIRFERRDGAFVIPAGLHSLGKVLNLSFEVPDASRKVFELGHTPIAGSTVVRDEVGLCNFGNGLSIEENRLLSTCMAEQEMNFSLSYKYLEPMRRFQVANITRPEHGKWEVFMNGEPIQDFIRSGSEIVLNSDPAPDASISVHYTYPE